VQVQEEAPVNQPLQEPLPRWARDLVEETQGTTVRLQQLSDHYHHTMRIVEILQADREFARAENLTLREHIANMEHRVQEVERHARLALDEVQELRDLLPNTRR